MTDQTSILHRFVEVLNTGRAEGLADLLAEDYVQHHAGGPAGRDGVIRYFQAIFDGFPGGRTTLEDLITDGVSLVGRVSFKGRHHGAFMGVEPTGREVEIRTLDIWRTRDGKLAEHWGETNIAEVVARLREPEAR